MAFQYSGNKTFDVDFTCSTDSVDELYNQLKADLKSYIGESNIITNDNIHAIAIKNSTGSYSIITVNQGYGFGFFSQALFDNSEICDFIAYTDFALFVETYSKYGQTDRCSFGSVQYKRNNGLYPDDRRALGQDEYINQILTRVDHSYGHDIHPSRLHHFSESHDVLYLTDWSSGTRPNVSYTINKQNYSELARRYSRYKVSDYCLRYLDTRASRFRLPRYCYGRVTYSIMKKDNGSWALYIHQTRPRIKPYDKESIAKNKRDFKPDVKRYGVVSVMFYDNESEISGWIMPQGPQPIGTVRFNHGPRTANLHNHHWAILSLSHNRLWITTEDNCFGYISANFKIDLNDIVNDYNHVIFNNKDNRSFSIKSLSVIDYKDVYTIDPDIIAQSHIMCSTDVHFNPDKDRSISDWSVGGGDHIILSPLKNYAQLSDDPSLIRRNRSDGTAWEFGGYGFIHRVE